MAINFMTGFEMGSIALPGVTSYKAAIETTKQTGVYGMSIQNGSGQYPYYVIPVSMSGADVYWGFHFYPSAFYTNNKYVYFELHYEDSSNYVRLEWLPASGNVVRFVRNGTVLATSAAGVIVNAWQHIQVYVHADNAAGVAQCKIAGNLVIDFSGDTLPSSQTYPSQVRYYGEARWDDKAYIDNIVIRDDDWPGDVRIEKLVPTADTADADFECSTGSDHYALIDEVPPSDTDYVYSDTDGDKDLYNITDFTGTDRTIVALCTWMRARKDTADSQQLKIMLKSGSTEDAGDAEDLTTSFAYYNRIDEVDPDTSAAWDDTGVDALQIGVEAVIP